MRVMPEGAAAPFLTGYIYVSPAYFEVLRIPIVRGRNFTAGEAQAGAPLVVISQAAARSLWPARDALGRSLRLLRDARAVNRLAEYRNGPPPYESVRVIGIARDAVNGWVGDGLDRAAVYFPVAAARANILLVRVNADAPAMRRRLDATLAAAIPGAVDQIHAMDEVLAAQIYPFRLMYWSSAVIGGLALALTFSGIYGVLSYLVTQRTKEIGIRLALGAGTVRVARLVVKQSMRLTLGGAVIGAAAAAGVTRILGSEFDAFDFGHVDGLAFGLGITVVILAAACAAYFPSRRAARLEPSITLRYD
jgi:hypothetical protein